METKHSPQPPWRHCTQIGDPILRHVCTAVPVNRIQDDDVQQLIKLMGETLRDYNLVGIAANQVGVQWSIMIIEVRKEYVENVAPTVLQAKEMEVFPLTVVINPKIKVINDMQKVFVEGCASVCGYCAEVARFAEVQLTGFNEKGQPVDLHLKGWTARVAQHEVDHLNGIVYTDIMDRKTFVSSMWSTVNDCGGQTHIPFYPKPK